MVAQGRHISDCFDYWGCIVQGTKGTAVLGEGKPDPVIYKGHKRTDDNIIWRFAGKKNDGYQTEIDLLINAIRQGKPYNETQRCINATMVGIMGRMAAESGKEIKWDEALASTHELAPGLDGCTMDSTPPIVPDEHGQYPIAMPGKTNVL